MPINLKCPRCEFEFKEEDRGSVQIWEDERASKRLLVLDKQLLAAQEYNRKLQAQIHGTNDNASRSLRQAAKLAGKYSNHQAKLFAAGGDKDLLWEYDNYQGNNRYSAYVTDIGPHQLRITKEHVKHGYIWYWDFISRDGEETYVAGYYADAGDHPRTYRFRGLAINAARNWYIESLSGQTEATSERAD